jgi:hypothetical protein
VAEDLEETCKLLELGFEYLMDMKGKDLFRKRKQGMSIHLGKSVL